MRVASRLFTIFLFFIAWVHAIIEEGDSQIFEMQHELAGLFGPKANFYSVLEIDRNADEKDIKKAYNRISLKWHPDKNPSKDAEPFYKIVTSIQDILRNSKKRARYDHYLTKGFPVWRGDNYYSSIWEPSAFTVFLFLLSIISVAQYIVLVIYYYQDIQKIKDYKREMEEKLASKTPAQLMKELKKVGSGSNISKKDLKRAGSDPNLSKDILAAAGLLEIPSDPIFPSVKDVVIVTLPLWIINKVSGILGKNDQETPKSK